MPAQPHKENEPNYPQSGKMIAVCSAKGGVGRTVLTTNIAVTLASKGLKACILDGCFQFGDIHLALDLQPMFSINDVIEQLETIDSDNLWHYLNRHDSGLRILTAPTRPEYADLVTIKALDKITNLLLSKLNYLLVDTMSGLHEQTLFFMERADEIFIITDLEMATLKNTKMMLSVLDTLDLRHKVRIIVNRSTMQSVITTRDVPQILGQESIFYIPNDFEVVSKSMNIGLPFIIKNRRADISKDIISMVEQFTSVDAASIYEPPTTPSSLSFFQKFKSKKERVK